MTALQQLMCRVLGTSEYSNILQGLLRCSVHLCFGVQGPHALQFLQYAAHCYMAGIKLSTANPAVTGMKTRNEEALTTSLDLLPRVLHLLSFDDKNGIVGEEIQKAVDERSLPTWIWFMWIQQLLTSLTRPEVHRVKPILKQLAEVGSRPATRC